MRGTHFYCALGSTSAYIFLVLPDKLATVLVWAKVSLVASVVASFAL